MPTITRSQTLKIKQELCGLDEEQVQKLMQSYESLYELVFMDCDIPAVYTSNLQCCKECDTWYHRDNKDADGKPMIIKINDDGEYMCHECYKEPICDSDEETDDENIIITNNSQCYYYSVEEHNEDGFTTEDFDTEEDAQEYFDNLGIQIRFVRNCLRYIKITHRMTHR